MAAIIVVAFQWYYFAPSSRTETSESVSTNQTTSEKKATEEQKISNFYLVDSKGQKKEFELWANEAHKPMGDTEWTMQEVKVQFYSEKATYVVLGARGTVDEENKGMVIEGDVRMNSSNGYHFYTDKLFYDAGKKEISTASKVSLEGPKEKEGRLYLEGKGLFVEIDKSEMVMQNDVSGFKPMSGGRVMKISSQRGEFSGRNKSVTFKNNVVILVDKMDVRGNLAKFQYKDNRLDTLYMDGGIHMQDPTKTGTAGEAIVYFNEDKYIFRKKPFLTQSENSLIGDEVIVFDGGKRVQVKNAKVEYYETEKKQ